MMTDKNASYFVQDGFKFKESHKKRAQTYNASFISCADDYTAYIIDEGKTVCVFYYNTSGLADDA